MYKINARPKDDSDVETMDDVNGDSNADVNGVLKGSTADDSKDDVKDDVMDDAVVISQKKAPVINSGDVMDDDDFKSEAAANLKEYGGGKESVLADHWWALRQEAKWMKEQRAVSGMGVASSEEALGGSGDGINDGSLQTTMEQMFMSIMYGSYSGTSSVLKLPTNSTIIPCMSLSSIRFSENVLENLKNISWAKSGDAKQQELYLSALAEFSQSVDKTFTFTKDQNDGSMNGDTLSVVWKDIVTVSSCTTPDDPEIVKRYNEIHAKLYDPSTGAETPLYLAYDAAKDKYMHARGDYIRQEIAYQSQPALWNQMGPLFQEQVQDALEKWVSSGKNLVEDYQAQLHTLLTGGTATLIDNANSLMKAAARNDVTFGTYYPTLMQPVDALSDDSQTWTSLTIKKGEDYSMVKTTAKEAGCSMGAFWNIFSVGGSGSDSKTTESMDDETSNCRIELDFCRVELYRSWMATDWMKAPDWNFGKLGAFMISKGTVADNTDPNLYLCGYPTALILAKNVVASAKFSGKTLESLKAASSGEATAGLGPFKIGSKYRDSSFEEVTDDVDINGRVNITAPQVIGYVVTAPPKSPPLGQ